MAIRIRCIRLFGGTGWSHEKQPPVAKLSDVTGLSPHEKAVANKAGNIELPSAKDLGYEWENELLLVPGEKAALEKLAEFCDDERAIAEYDEQRNLPGHRRHFDP